MKGDTQHVGPVRRFPFSAVVGQDEARLALLLAAIDPAIGGVLLRGSRGSARTTLARGLAGLLPGGAPLVEVPLGASENGVLGAPDPTVPLTERKAPSRAGLLAGAHRGVIYVHEVNLQPDHLVRALLDVAASGTIRAEGDGVSHEHAVRFALVGSMNPEAGELRPELLDRFGLAIEVKAPTDAASRAEVVRRRLTHDAGGAVGDEEGDIVLRARLAAAMPADLPAQVVDFACHLAVSVGAEGLRADLVLCRAAAAFAGWHGRAITTEADVERVAALVLGHRRQRRPFDPPTLTADELDRALDATRQAFASAAGASAAGASAAGTAATGIAATPAAGPASDTASPPIPQRDASEAGPASGDPGTDTDTGTSEPGEAAPAHQAAGDPGTDTDTGTGEPGEAAPAHQAAGDPGTDTDTGTGEPTGGHQTDSDTGTDELSEAAPAHEASGHQTDAGTDELSEAAPAHEATGHQTDADNGTGEPTTGHQAAADTGAERATGQHLTDVDTGTGELGGAAPAYDMAGDHGAEPEDPAGAGAPTTATEPGQTAPEHDAAGGGPMHGTGPAAGPGPSSNVAVATTVRASAQRRQVDPQAIRLDVSDGIGAPVSASPAGRTVVIAVDASGSAGTHRRVEAAAGAVLGLLADAYLRRDRVALLTFRGTNADVVLPPTASVELARASLDDVPTGGVTPLAEGLSTALATARQATAEGWPPLLVVITDGQATGDPTALDRSRQAAAEIAAASVDTIVLDAEDGPARRGLAEQLATSMGARYLQLEQMSAARVEAAVRGALA